MTLENNADLDGENECQNSFNAISKEISKIEKKLTLLSKPSVHMLIGKLNELKTVHDSVNVMLEHTEVSLKWQFVETKKTIQRFRPQPR